MDVILVFDGDGGDNGSMLLEPFQVMSSVSGRLTLDIDQLFGSIDAEKIEV